MLMHRLRLVLSCLAFVGARRGQPSVEQLRRVLLSDPNDSNELSFGASVSDSWKTLSMLHLKLNARGALRRRQERHASANTCNGGRRSSVTMSDEPVEFFTLEMCPYAQRVWITLEELGVPYKAKQVSLRGGDREWYTKEINPRGKVPAIRDPSGLIIYESLICMEYLAEQFDSGTLMPSSPAERARMRLWSEHLDSQLAPAHFTLLMNKDEATSLEKQAALDSALAFYEEHIEGPYLLGDTFTLADVAALPFFERLVFSLRHFKQYDALASYPRTAMWLKMVMERPSVAKTLRPEEKLVEVYERFLSMDYDFGGLNKNKR